jgi:DNA repair protein RadC
LFVADARSKPADANAAHRARLREKMLVAGGAGFADYELLEYLLALAIPRIDTKPIAKALIAEFGELAAVLAAPPEALQRIERVGPAAAAALKFVEAAALRASRIGAESRPAIAGSDALMAYLHAAHAHLTREEVRVLFLDSKNQLIKDEVIAAGTINQATVHVREVVRRAIELGAAALILVHNHPSGDPTPSGADIALTRDIVTAARLFDVAVHDHFIIGRGGHTSLRSAGLM